MQCLPVFAKLGMDIQRFRGVRIYIRYSQNFTYLQIMYLWVYTLMFYMIQKTFLYMRWLQHGDRTMFTADAMGTFFDPKRSEYKNTIKVFFLFPLIHRFTITTQDTNCSYTVYAHIETNMFL